MVVAIGRGWRASLAGSDYLEVVNEKVAGTPPVPDIAFEKRCADLVRHLVSDGMIDTAHDVSAGGEIVALAEMALAGGLGIDYEEIEVEALIDGKGGGRAEVGLFGENGLSFIVAVPEERWDDLQNALGDVPYDSIARVGGDRLILPGLIDLSLDELRDAYEQDLFGVPGEAVGGSEAVG